MKVSIFVSKKFCEKIQIKCAPLFYFIVYKFEKWGELIVLRNNETNVKKKMRENRDQSSNYDTLTWWRKRSIKIRTYDFHFDECELSFNLLMSK